MPWSHCIGHKMSPGMTPELEIILAEGAGMEPGYSSDKVSSPFACFSVTIIVTKRIASELILF